MHPIPGSFQNSHANKKCSFRMTILEDSLITLDGYILLEKFMNGRLPKRPEKDYMSGS